MTGFLGRMAARASGREAGISPRVPSRFEGVERAEPDAVEPDAVEPAAAMPAKRSEPTPPVVAAARLEPTPADMAPEHPAAPPPPAVDRGVAELPAEPVRVAVPAELRPLEAPSVEEARSPRARPVDRPEPDPPVVPVARDLLVVPAAPAAALARAAALVPTGAAAAVDPSPREPDVVHVSIGRVDVRASVAPPRQPAPREQTRQPARASAERLSLQDYLRGQREVR